MFLAVIGNQRPTQVLNKLEEAWLNEKHSPDLLEPKMELVECMLEQVQEKKLK